MTAQEASGPIVTNVEVMTQRGEDIYIFTLLAKDLLQYCKIERFNETDNGVQRQQRDRKVKELVLAMRRPDTIFVEPITVHLSGGEWTYSRKSRELTAPIDGFLSVDDGQHRLAALAQLSAKEQKDWSFSVHATSSSLSHDRRVRMFLQQDLGEGIDQRLLLAQRDYINDWPNDMHRDAYQICKILDTDEDSVLYGRVLFDDIAHRPREDHGDVTNKINVTGLHSALVKAKGRGSPLNQLSVVDQAKVLKTYLRVASETWPGSWNGRKQMLSTVRGVGALISLFRRSAQFVMFVDVELTELRFREVFALMKPYSWSILGNRHMTPNSIVDRLDSTIVRSLERSQKQREVVID